MMNTNTATAQGDKRRTIAIDWSGAANGASSKIWLAEVYDKKLVRLESGRDRSKVIQHVIDCATTASEIVVGLDFAFSFPLWFARQNKENSAEGLWKHVRERGEAWLQNCSPPFWGRPGKKKPKFPGHFRLTELEVSQFPNIHPKSVFQIGGAGAVGTGSIRGMPYLTKLHNAGFSIWPFHEAKSRMVIEIYPRLLTGQVNKSDYDERLKILCQFQDIDIDLAYKAACSEDAFDAAVSAVRMSQCIGDLSSSFRQSDDPTKQIEGEIWQPPLLAASAEM